jgi:hypothetical protein
MSGSDEDLGKMTDLEKLDRILGQLATMNNRLDAHAQRLALLEQEHVQPTGSPLAPPLVVTTLSTGPALESHAVQSTPILVLTMADSPVVVEPHCTAVTAIAMKTTDHDDQILPSPTLTVKLTPCLGSTNATHIFAAWAFIKMSGFGRHPCTWKASQQSGFMPWSVTLVVYSLGQGL